MTKLKIILDYAFRSLKGHLHTNSDFIIYMQERDQNITNANYNSIWSNTDDTGT